MYQGLENCVHEDESVSPTIIRHFCICTCTWMSRSKTKHEITCAHNGDSDEPEHQHDPSLIRLFAVCSIRKLAGF